jgi:hypothetical protein
MLIIYLTILIFGQIVQEHTNRPQDPASYIIKEEFSNLDNWENFSFSGNKEPTLYTLVNDSNISYLNIISNSSASGLIHKNKFDPTKFPVLSWRWRVDNLINDADGKTKSGDDYTIRIFVLFDDDSAETSFWTSIRNSTIKLLYGTEPPESSLCFVWSNMTYNEKYFDSPYSETVKIIPVEMGETRLQQWHSYDINIGDLYREIFGRSCPSSAKLAIMSDTDNTESNSVAGLDYIRINTD